MSIKVFSVNTELDKVTGVQKVLMDIHDGIKGKYTAKIIGTIPFSKVNRNNCVVESEYIQLKNPFILRNSVAIIHERKLTSFLYVLNAVLFLKMKIIYVHHNIYDSGRIYTWFPKHIVSISDRVTENLIEYFKVKPNWITKISNGIRDKQARKRVFDRKEKIKVLYAARINDVKRQLEVVEKLDGRIGANIELLFAGDGPKLSELQQKTAKHSNFKSLGFIADIPALIEQCDYMLLFSTKEGLPITLIEAAMCSTPLIVNDVGGNLEIARPNENGIVVDNWENLIEQLNKLTEIDEAKYMDMSKRSREIYEENFSYQGMINKYIELINKSTK